MTRFDLRLLLIVVCALGSAELPRGAVAQAPSPGLVILSSNGVRAPLEDARQMLEATVGLALEIRFSTAAALSKRIEGGEHFDVAILTPDLIGLLERDGQLAIGSSAAVARTGVGAGARAGTAYPVLDSAAALRALLLDADSVAFTRDGQSRRTIDAAFETLGITDSMAPKTLLLGPGEAPRAVTAGDAELVLTLVSEILPVEGLALIGTFPPTLQAYTRFAAAVSARTAHEQAARYFVSQLAAARFVAVLREHGLEATPLAP